MKIVYTHDVFSTQPYGGISRYIYEISKGITESGQHQVEIFAPLHVNRYFEKSDELDIRGVRVPYIPRAGRFVLSFNAAASRFFVKPRRNVDILHETYYTSEDCSPGKARRVITCHDMIHEKFSGIISPKDKTAAVKREAVKRADHIICNSKNTRKDLIEILNVPEERTSVTHLGCSMKGSESDAVPFEARKAFILYVGHRFVYKNFERFLRAFSMSGFLKKEFSIVCFGGGELSNKEREFVSSLHVPSEKLIWMSGNDAKLADLYASAKVFVYPSLYEGFGIPPLEAMALGCPVACSNTSSIPEVVGDAAELFDPTDEEMMCAAIERVITDTVRSKKLIEAGYKRVRQFSWAKCAQETLDAYSSLL